MFGTMNTGSNYYSDYGSGTSSNSSTSWPHSDIWAPHQSNQNSPEKPTAHKAMSYQDLVMGKCTLEDIMKEFQMNGLDSPYTPNEDNTWFNQAESLSGLGPPTSYLRQKSWPAPERSPAVRLPRPHSDYLSSHTPVEFNPQEFTTSTPVEEVSSGTQQTASAAFGQGQGAQSSLSQSLSEDQLRVLKSLPQAVLLSLLGEFEQNKYNVNKRPKKMECRFCKNNGERESYYRSHSLKGPCGRVCCPVLRAFTCPRCGARGDTAHTAKYCPLSTADDRMKSAAMLRSVRMASGRRRQCSVSPPGGQRDTHPLPSVLTDTNLYNAYTNMSPLDPSWAALEQKLLSLKFQE